MSWIPHQCMRVNIYVCLCFLPNAQNIRFSFRSRESVKQIKHTESVSKRIVYSNNFLTILFCGGWHSVEMVKCESRERKRDNFSTTNCSFSLFFYFIIHWMWFQRSGLYPYAIEGLKTKFVFEQMESKFKRLQYRLMNFINAFIYTKQRLEYTAKVHLQIK